MDRNTYRDDDDLDEPATYWWRRAVTLVAGLGVLGLVAWALSSGGGKPPGTPPPTPPVSTPAPMSLLLVATGFCLILAARKVWIGRKA